MLSSSPKQRGFPPVAGPTVRADVAGGAWSSDCGPLLLRGIDRQSGLPERLAAALHDRRHPSSLDHPLRDLCAQRLSHSASGDADGHDANRLRHDPLGTLGVERRPVDPEPDVASAPPCSRLAPQGDRQDLSRLTPALVDHFRASSPEPPAAIGLALEHADDPTHGQQELAFSHPYYKTHCDRPLFLLAGPSPARVTAYRRPGTRPTGADKAMIWVRLLSSLRRHWPPTPLLVRGDRPGATPEIIEVIAPRRWTDLVFGLAGHAVLLRHAASGMQAARRL